MAYYISGSPSPSISTTTTSPGLTLGTTSPSSLWTNVNSTAAATVSISNDIRGSTLQVKGDADISGDLKVQGKSIAESLESIEARLAILRPNEELEEKWENLRGLRKMYMELEAEIIEKEKIWGILKK